MLTNKLILPILIAIITVIVGFSISLQKQTKKATKFEIENMKLAITVTEAQKAEKTAKDSLVIAKGWILENSNFTNNQVAEIQQTIRVIALKSKVLQDSVTLLKKGVIYKYKLLKARKGLFNKGYDTLSIN